MPIANEVTIENVRQLLRLLGFSPKNGEAGTWKKAYSLHNNYEITVSLEDIDSAMHSINYGSRIVVRRSTILSLTKQENLVSLECIDRLLSLGYSPDRIILEQTWNLGHDGKGYLDIFVKNEDGAGFMMIECKTWGHEFNNEKQKMLKDGGQLFSYLQQDQSTQFIVLYASKYDDRSLTFQYDFVANKSDFRGKSVAEAYEIWDKAFETKGLLEQSVKPYTIELSGIKESDLRNIEPEVGGLIFNQFAEILRRHVVSDKTNAFNKIFNLFLCKIVDEDNNKNTNNEMAFQWKRTDTFISLFSRLNDLYKQGLQNYLGMEVTDYSDKDIEEKLSNFQDIGTKEDIKRIITELRLYKDNELAFKEVYNKETFELNALVVKEVLELLQPYRIRYSSKQQYLGDFFELLLNTGIKQEAGQFFTPIPIARFICRSIPIKALVDKKNFDKETNFLPYVIDYASGSGHFLTEVMDEIDSYISQIKEEQILGGRRAIEKFNAEKKNYMWAKEYIYGIEKDYRLAKTTKISTFLNGDGDARIISGDGLDDFFRSDKYIGILKSPHQAMDNQVFDILVANPPYSVDGFKNTLNFGGESFELYKYLTDKSAEIECLFLERAKQLVKDNGYIGIILPSSLLTNEKIYEAARDLLLKYFDIKGIVSLGSGTFMATGTNTVILYLQRKNVREWQMIQKIVENFLISLKDVTCNGIERAFSKYVDEVYVSWKLEDYVSFLKGNKSEKIVSHEIFKEYQEAYQNQSEYQNLIQSREYEALSEGEQERKLQETFSVFVSELEKKKLCVFMLTYNKPVVIASSGDSDIEKAFLGYEFSNRRGHEGIKIYRDKNNKVVNKLYNEDDLLDPTKVSSYIYKNFLSLPIKEIDENLKDHLSIDSLHTLIEFEQPYFTNKINVRLKKKLKFNSKFPLVKIRKLNQEYIQGVTYAKSDESRTPTNNIIVTASNIDIDTGEINLEEKRYLRESLVIPEVQKLKAGDMFICTSSGSLRHLGKSAFINNDMDLYFGGFCSVLRFQDITFAKYVSVILKTPEFRSYVECQVGQNINNLGKDYFLDYKLPLPTPETYKKIVSEISSIEEKEQRYKAALQNSHDTIHKIFKSVFEQSSVSLKRLGTAITFLQRGKTPDYGFSSTQVIKSGQIRGYYDFDFSQKAYVSETFSLDERLLQKGDLLINSTGVGTAGRVNYFDLDGDFLVDGHVSILRLNRELLLPKYALYCFSYIGFSNLEAMATGRSGQVELSPDVIRSLRFPLIGDVIKQKEILLEVEKHEQLINQAKNNLILLDQLKLKKLDEYLS